MDTGGTFTDLAIVDEQQRLITRKVPSTPDDPSRAVIAVLGEAARLIGMSVQELLSQVAGFAHGTTIATNAFLERKGCVTGLLTTQGFGDTLFVQRLMGITAGVRREALAHFSQRSWPDPLVPRNRVFEIAERMDAAGAVVSPLDESAVARAARGLRAQGVQAVAVCYLWSFLNPDHERRTAEILRELLPEAHIALSVDVAPVLGEYERTATTVINAYLGPGVIRYLRRLQETLQSHGMTVPLAVLNSAGGVSGLETVGDQVVGLLLSGPTAGVTASVHLARSLCMPGVITTDMGGTSFDAGLIIDGEPLVQRVVEIGKYHVASPMLAIETIGAGGGSIARVRDGYLTVGPESAGAVPGPACYGRGGEEPTVTDADLVLGILDPARMLDGRLHMEMDLARQAIEQHVAHPLGVSVEVAAAGIRRIVSSQMGDLLRRMTVERGFDPADLILYAYGGAGPSHCCSFAAELGVREIVVPVTSTVHSAYGAAASDLVYTAERSLLLRTPAGFGRASDHWDPAALDRRFTELEQRCREALAGGTGEGGPIRFERSAEMRFRRQTQSLPVSVPHELNAGALDDLVERFQQNYERRYGAGSSYREAGVELVTCRVRAVVERPRPNLAIGGMGGTTSPIGERQVYHLETSVFSSTAVYDGEELHPGAAIPGPAAVHYPMTTVILPPGWTATVDPFRNFRITHNPQT